jgi:hypothetical protein
MKASETARSWGRVGENNGDQSFMKRITAGMNA